jgi:hypothetical protein
VGLGYRLYNTNLRRFAYCFASDDQPEILDAHGYRGLDIGLLVGCPFRLLGLSHSKTMDAIRPLPMEVNKLLSEERDIRSWAPGKLSPFISMDALPRLNELTLHEIEMLFFVPFKA